MNWLIGRHLYQPSPDGGCARCPLPKRNTRYHFDPDDTADVEDRTEPQRRDRDDDGDARPGERMDARAYRERHAAARPGP